MNIYSDFIYLLGNLTLLGILIAIFLIAILGILIIIALTTGKTYFPNLMILLINAFHSPTRSLLTLLGHEDDLVAQAEVKLRNKLNQEDYSKVPYNQRMILLPQCLRDSKRCPAKTTSEGIQCIKCGQCVIKQIKEKAEPLGYHVAIAPGGTFAKRLIKQIKPKAVLGVGCLFELKEGLDACNRFRVPAQGVLLSKTGCMDTIIDVEKLFETIDMIHPTAIPVESAEKRKVKFIE